LELPLSEKQIPQVIENVVNSKHRMEGLEWRGMLAKQVLSQLSYTPTVGYSNHFPSLSLPPQRLVPQKSWSSLEQVQQIQFQPTPLLRAARSNSL
jgi:hypothetical protein